MTSIVDSLLIRADATGVFSKTQLEVLRRAAMEIADRYVIRPRKNEVARKSDLQPEAYKAFLVLKKANGLSDRSLKQYKYELDRFLLAVGKPLERITSVDIQLYLYKMQNERNNSVTSVNNIRACLGSFFGWAYRQKYLEEDPTLNVPVVKGLKKVYVPLTNEQFELVMNKAKTQRDKAILAVLAGSGIRLGELVGMKLNRLDLQSKRFYVTGKGSKERVCFLTPRAACELKLYLDSREDDCEYVFVTIRKPYRKLGATTVERMMTRLGEQVGFNLHPHMLRHYFADAAHEAGIDTIDISRMLGHESVKTTQIYMSIKTDDLAYKHTRLR